MVPKVSVKAILTTNPPLEEVFLQTTKSIKNI